MRKLRCVRKLGSWLSMLLLMLSFALSALPSTSFAAEGGEGGESGGVVTKCKMIKEDIARSDIDDVWLVEYIVTCIKTTVTDAFLQFLQGFYDAVEVPIQAAITLAVVLFGGLMLTGMIEKPARDSLIFLLKLASVAYFVQVSTAHWVFESGLGAMDDLTEMVWTVGQVDSSIRCPDQDTIWDGVDCVLDVLVGIRKDVPEEGIEADDTEVSPDKYGISRGMMHFFFSNLSSSGTGAVVIAALGLYTVFAFLMALIKSIHTYLAAILALAFILMMMPMFVPLLLFKATRNYFDKWYRIAISFILQPVILFGFLSLMLIAIDTLLVSGDNSVLNMIKGDNCDKKVVSECLEDKGVYESRSMYQYRQVTREGCLDGALTRTDEGVAKGARTTEIGRKLTEAEKSCLIKAERPFEGMDYSALASAMDVEDDAEAKEMLAYAAIITALTMFVFISMLNYIPVLATDLAGGVFEVPNLYEKVGSNFLGADQAERMAQKASQTVRGKMDPYLQQFENMVRGRN